MINSVRNTVLSVLNKNNYGYISPSDFNLFSKQAQLEIFEDYFKEYNKTINLENARASGVDYADQKRIIEDAIEIFAEYRLLNLAVGIAGESTFSIPSPTTTGDVLYVINKIIYYTDPIISGVNTAVVINELDDTSVDFIALGVVPGDIVTTGVNGVFAIVTSITSATRLVLSTDLFPSVGLTYYIQPTKNFKEIDKVNLSVINSLRLSNLTFPSTMFPVYTHRGDNLIVYPDSISSFGQVRASYFRLPNDPKWTYTSLLGGQPSFDQSQLDYQDFELSLEDEYKLCTKILQYCGLSIREAEIVQYMTGKEIQEKQS